MRLDGWRYENQPEHFLTHLVNGEPPSPRCTVCGAHLAYHDAP
jgi:hypothetical protein